MNTPSSDDPVREALDDQKRTVEVARSAIFRALDVLPPNEHDDEERRVLQALESVEGDLLDAWLDVNRAHLAVSNGDPGYMESHEAVSGS